MLHLRLRAFPYPHDWAPSAGQLLTGGTVVAIVLANSGAADSFAAFWQQPLGLALGSTTFALPLSGWITEGLLTVFFLVVGLEIKREVMRGSLHSIRAAALPIAAAIGGMTIPATLFLALAPGQWSHAWGIPMSADTAFVVALIVAIGARAPTELRMFLIASMVVDDIIAVSVVALFYSGAINLDSLLGAGAVFLALACLAHGRVQSLAPYLALGSLLWFLVFDSGVHATLTGILLAAVIPADGPDSPADRLLARADARSAYVILPLFALANAGIRFAPGMLAGREALALAIGAGLVIGKPAGILGACWLAVRFGLATKPDSVSWRHILGAGALCGVGFTMSLFIAGQTLEGADLEAAKAAILGASLLSATIGVLILILRRH